VGAEGCGPKTRPGASIETNNETTMNLCRNIISPEIVIEILLNSVVQLDAKVEENVSKNQFVFHVKV
jgi:hypothetical protein